LGFAVASQLAARTRPHCQFVFLRSKVCYPLLSAFVSRLGLAVSLRLPSSAPIGSFHPIRLCPCWAHWRKHSCLPRRHSPETILYASDSKCGARTHQSPPSRSTTYTPSTRRFWARFCGPPGPRFPSAVHPGGSSSFNPAAAGAFALACRVETQTSRSRPVFRAAGGNRMSWKSIVAFEE
jgi:hypothetical protein